MKELIKYELKKCFFTPLMFIIVFGATFFNIVAIVNDGYSKSVLISTGNFQNAFFYLYDDFVGEINNEKIIKLLDLYNPLQEAVADQTAKGSLNNDNLTGTTYGDYNLVHRFFYTQIKQFYQYKSYANEILSKAYDNVQFYSEKQDKYEVLRNTKIYRIFENRSIKNFEYTEHFERLIEYKTSTYILLMICLFGVSCVYPKEKETQMSKLILISRNGTYKSSLAKLFACAVFIVIVAVWFAIVDYLGYAVIFSTNSGVHMPLYSLTGFQNTPLNISLIEFNIFKTALRILGLFAICFIGIIISLPFANGFYPTIINIFGACILLSSTITNSNTNYFYKQILNPLSLICPEILVAKTSFVNFFNTPVLVISATIWFSCLIIIVCIIMLFFFAQKSYIKKHYFCKTKY